MDPKAREFSRKDDFQHVFFHESDDVKDILMAYLNSKCSQKPNFNRDTFFALKKQADSGSADAQFEIGECYEEGKDVQQSYQSALHYYQLAANQGLCKAQLHLALLYEDDDNLGVKQDLSKAFHYYQLAAEQESPGALAQLGQFYQKGKGGIEKSAEKAIEYYQKAADLESLAVWVYLAEAYEEGIGVKKSLGKANFYRRKRFLYTKKRADEGDAEAQALVGWFFEQGEGVENSITSAFYYYQLSADQNCSKGLFHLGKWFEEGIGVEKSPEKAIYYYQLAADRGYSLAQYSLARYLIENKIHEEQAIHYLKLMMQKKCSKGILSLAEYDLGYCFEEGIGIKQSIPNALYYYQSAADHGSCSAQHRLEDAYLYGELGLKKSLEKAMEYDQLTAHLGDPSALRRGYYCKKLGGEKSIESAMTYFKMGEECDAQEINIEPSAQESFKQNKLEAEQVDSSALSRRRCYNKISILKAHRQGQAYGALAFSYQEGKGCDQSYEEAVKYLKLGADQGDCYCQRLLGIYYEKGWGVEKSLEEAFKYYCLAADQGDAHAACLLGELYRLGNGVDQDFSKAVYYHKLAAARGSCYGQSQLGICYKEGSGVEKSLEEAFKYFRLAADQGDDISQFQLGVLYEEGSGVEKSLEEAFKYYRLSADQGYFLGQFHAARCYKGGIGVKKSLEKAIEYYERALAQDNNTEEILKQIEDCKNVNPGI